MINRYNMALAQLLSKHKNQIINRRHKFQIRTYSNAVTAIILVANQRSARNRTSAARLQLRSPVLRFVRVAAIEQRRRQSFRERIPSFEHLLDHGEDGHDGCDAVVVEDAYGVG